MNQERLMYLLECYSFNRCSESEKKELDKWFHGHNPGSLEMHKWLNEANGSDALSSELFADYQQRIRKPSKFNYSQIAAIAASLFFVLLTGYFLFNNIGGKKPGLSGLQTKADVKPGGNKAILTLENGEQIVLNDAKVGQLARQSESRINKLADSNITYQAANVSIRNKKLVYNTLSTPPGGKYNLTLADGTEVTLDAASSIKFPVAFNGKERRVEVVGQAYFKVVHDNDKPFYVIAKGQIIKDIGTEFNVSAYNDDATIKVTLAEGLVEVSNSKNSVSLIPGQQATVLNDNPSIAVNAVHVSDIIAWKNGWFIFRHESMANIMKQAARWYDVEIVYEGHPVTKKIGGNISKYKNISELLENLKITSGINYKIEGRRVTLMN